MKMMDASSKFGSKTSDASTLFVTPSLPPPPLSPSAPAPCPSHPPLALPSQSSTSIHFPKSRTRVFAFSKKMGYRQTNGRTDGPADRWTDGRTESVPKYASGSIAKKMKSSSSSEMRSRSHPPSIRPYHSHVRP